MVDREIREVAIDVLERIERRLNDIARRNRVNAVLWMAEPSLVLPSPAVGTLAIRCGVTTRLTPRHVFRSVEPVGPDGDVTLGIVPREFLAHPWEVRNVSWTVERKASRILATGLDVMLERRGSMGGPGWLSLGFDSNPWLSWAFERARVTCGDERLTMRRLELPISLNAAAPPGPSPLHFHLEAITAPMVQVELSRAAAAADKAALRFHFEDPIPYNVMPESPRVETNVVPVWNSRDCSYPGAGQFEQTTSESHSRRLHPLSAEDLGSSWRAWSIEWVGASDDSRARLAAGGGLGFKDQDPTYDLALSASLRDETVAKHQGSDVDGCVLSVVLSDRARRMLDERGHRLRMEFRATTGSRANGIGAGSKEPVEFELEDPFGLAAPERIVGRLVGSTWGGTDGWTASNTADLEDLGLEAVLAGGASRRVADVAAILERWFGNDLELLDERDLLRTTPRDVHGSLAVRVQFRRPDRPQNERRLVLRSCRHFLGHYLANTPYGGLELIEAEPARTSHAG